SAPNVTTGLGSLGGDILIFAPGKIALGGAIDAYVGLDGAGITRACCGSIAISGGGTVTQAAPLTTDLLSAAGTDVNLNLSNSVNSVFGVASNGNFTFNNCGNLGLLGVSALGIDSIWST